MKPLPKPPKSARMATRTSPLVGQPATAAALIDVAKRVAAYYSQVPEPSIPV